jgi:DNA-binding CsgD family transcriptional regulator
MKYVGHALVDLGRLEAARAMLDGALEQIGPVDETVRDAGSREVLGEALSILARIEYQDGRPRSALSTAERAARLYAHASVSDAIDLAPLVAVWSRLDLGMPIEPDMALDPRRTEPARQEILAVQALSAGRPGVAAGAFERAADLWRGRSFGGLLRCRWAQGDSLRCAGEVTRAVRVLEDAEELACDHGYAGQLARIERTLRLCGKRRSAPRRRTESLLTGREQEVLVLVGHGLSNEAIARRLGVGRPTVVRLVRNASRKLGAETRAQAAVLAANA